MDLKKQITSILKSNQLSSVENEIANYSGCVIYEEDDLSVLGPLYESEIRTSFLEFEEIKSFIFDTPKSLIDFSNAFLNDAKGMTLCTGFSISYSIYVIYLKNKSKEELLSYLTRRKIPKPIDTLRRLEQIEKEIKQIKNKIMKAIICEKHGPPSDLVYKEVPNLKPGPKEVVVSVKACALNFPDTLIIQGKYQFKPDLPFSPGSDIAGVIKSIGEEVKNLKVGDEVFGFVAHGGFAEEVIVNAKQVFPKLPNMDFPIAASFMMAYGTSYYALKDRAKLQEGETLVVLGASGGVGLAAVELGKIMGAKVIACASTTEKLDLCKKHGADEVINYTNEDLKKRIKELTEGKGADVIYDPVGGAYSEAALRATAWEGRHLVIGFAAGDIPKIPLNLTLLKGCQIVGVFWGSFAMKNPKANMQNSIELMTLFSEGKLKPHIHKIYPLEEAPKALEEMMNRAVMGKVVVVV